MVALLCFRVNVNVRLGSEEPLRIAVRKREICTSTGGIPFVGVARPGFAATASTATTFARCPATGLSTASTSRTRVGAQPISLLTLVLFLLFLLHCIYSLSVYLFFKVYHKYKYIIPRWRLTDAAGTARFRSHDFDSQDFKLSVPNPRTVAYVQRSRTYSV
jgi:hypothetical protein